MNDICPEGRSVNVTSFSPARMNYRLRSPKFQVKDAISVVSPSGSGSPTGDSVVTSHGVSGREPIDPNQSPGCGTLAGGSRLVH